MLLRAARFPVVGGIDWSRRACHLAPGTILPGGAMSVRLAGWDCQFFV